jgi:hypothetical protein
MMNPIGLRDEEEIGSREPWFEDRRATLFPEHDGADPGGSTVRGSRWPGWRRVTGRSCGRRAPPGSASTRPSTATRSPPPAASAAASASPPGPSSAPPPPAASGTPSPSAQERGSLPARPWRERGTLLTRAGARVAGPSRPGAGAWVPGPVGPGLGRVIQCGCGTHRFAARGGRWRRRGRACISCLSRRGRVGCGRPSCRRGVGAGWGWRSARLR